MEDREIIELFFSRNEDALNESQKKYGRYLFTVAKNVLGDEGESQDMLNSAWLKAWNTIPPNRPESLRLYLAKIIRELSIDLFRRKRAVKRGAGQYESSLEELSECVSVEGPEKEVETGELAGAVSAYLRTLSDEHRNMFIMRYWFMDSIKDISAYLDCSQSKVKSALFRTRNGLKDYLIKEELL